MSLDLLNTFLEKQRTGLVPKKVQVVPERGKIYWATRWVRPLSEEEKIFTAEEKRVLENYKSYDFAHINSFLRHEKHTKYEDPEKRYYPDDFLLSEILLMDEAFVKQPPLDMDIIVYRGIRSDKMFTKYDVGNIFVDRGFVSTSRSEVLAKNFGKAIKIRVPKGTKVIDLEFVMPYKEQKDREQESLLPRNTKFKVISMHELEVIND